MYELIINGIVCTREEFALDLVVFSSDEISELFETGSLTRDGFLYEVKAVSASILK